MAGDGGRLRQFEAMLPWLATAFSAIAAIGGVWGAIAIQSQAHLMAEEAALSRAVALIRYCDLASKSDFRPGLDDVLVLHGHDGDSDYATEADAHDINLAVPSSVSSMLRCRFTNLSRVPLLNVTFTARVDFHKGKTPGKPVHNEYPFVALDAGKTRSVWIVDDQREPVVVHDPERIRYVRFPTMTRYQEDALPSLGGDSWTISHNAIPVPHLGIPK